MKYLFGLKIWTLVIVVSLSILYSCEPDDADQDLIKIQYEPQAYELKLPSFFPELPENSNNPLTIDGVKLGRFLFYDPILSSDSTLSCASCHKPEFGFTDGKAFSTGVTGQIGNRSSMSLLNVAYFTKGLFWDGRSASLETQALEPVENPIELHESWPNVERKLRQHPQYPSLFRKAFGIESRSEIKKELAAKALAQFQKILITGGNSRYAKQLEGKTFFDSDEQEGMEMYFNSNPALPDAQCGHCHAFPTFQSSDYFNNGLDLAQNLSDFKDAARGAVSGIPLDSGRFKAVGLFNWQLTAPYMHDGRFNTMEEVLDHYTSQVKSAPNLDPNVANLKINARQKAKVLAFLKTLLDTSYLQNPEYLNPF